MKSLQKEQNSTNLLLWPPICRNKPAITPKWFNSLDTNSTRNGCKTNQSNFFETPSITSKKIDRLLHISCSDNAIMVVASNCIHSIRVTSYKNQPLPLSITLSSIQGTHKKLVCKLSKGQIISKGLFGTLGFFQKTNKQIRF